MKEIQATTVFTTKEDLINTKVDLIKCPPDRTGRDGWILAHSNGNHHLALHLKDNNINKSCRGNYFTG